MVDLHRNALTLDAVLASGEALGRRLRPGAVVLLRGEMGAGKTTLTRALARGLGVDRPDRVCSPTFNICVLHPGPIPLIHIDLFRLAPGPATSSLPASFEALGLQDLLDQLGDEADTPAAEASSGVVVVEWPELGSFESHGALEIELVRPPGQLESRHLHAVARGPKHEDLLRAWAASFVGPA